MAKWGTTTLCCSVFVFWCAPCVVGPSLPLVRGSVRVWGGGGVGAFCPPCAWAPPPPPFPLVSFFGGGVGLRGGAHLARPVSHPRREECPPPKKKKNDNRPAGGCCGGSSRAGSRGAARTGQGRPTTPKAGERKKQNGRAGGSGEGKGLVFFCAE
jgi:hypothetical protein